MKKVLLTLFAVAALTAAFATNNPKQDVFGDDLGRIEQDFSGLNALEQVVTDRDATYEQLAAENNELLGNVTAQNDLGASLLGSNAPDERLLGIPGFWWGCLGLIGVVLVYVAIDDPVAKKREGRQALIGCLVWTALWTLVYLLLWSSVFFAG
jgi:hypothetical protein